MKTADYLERYLHVSYDISKIYRFLDSLCYRKESANSIAEDADVNKVSTKKTNGKNKPKPDYKSLVEQISYNHTKKVVGGSISVCFYDMTTLYFEATDEDDLRKAGFSKDGKHSNPQIFLGLLVASGGNPIGYEIYEGNIYEGNTIVPLVKALAERFSFGKPVVVADAGLLSKKNIDALTLDGYEYIIGARPKSESENIKERILSLGLKQGNIMEIDKGNGVRLILSSSEKRAHKDKRMREKGLARLQKKVKSGKLTKQSINNRGYNKYLKLNGTVEVSIDMNKFEADAAWDGIKGYLTNTKLISASCARDDHHIALQHSPTRGVAGLWRSCCRRHIAADVRPEKYGCPLRGAGRHKYIEILIGGVFDIGYIINMSVRGVFHLITLRHDKRGGNAAIRIKLQSDGRSL